MRFNLRSLIDSASFLWEIYPKIAPGEEGVRGRLGTMSLALLSWKSDDVPRTGMRVGVVVDSNHNKALHAERVFGRPMVIVDPLAIRHNLRWRVALLLTCMLPTRSRAVAVALVHARNLSGRLTTEQRVYLWNPYTLMQFAVSEVLAVEATYHLTASYPRLRSVEKAYGCEVALDLLGYAASERVNSLQPWSFTRDEPVLVIYLSKLEVLHRFESESRLLDAVRAWRQKTTAPIEIFLHYSDRQNARQERRNSAFFDEFGHLVTESDSLGCLSTHQISLSALSTVGLDLLSMNVAHFVMLPSVAVPEPLLDWRSRLDHHCAETLRYEDSPDRWMASIRDHHPDLFKTVFAAWD